MSSNRITVGCYRCQPIMQIAVFTVKLHPLRDVNARLSTLGESRTQITRSIGVLDYTVALAVDFFFWRAKQTHYNVRTISCEKLLKFTFVRYLSVAFNTSSVTMLLPSLEFIRNYNNNFQTCNAILWLFM